MATAPAGAATPAAQPGCVPVETSGKMKPDVSADRPDHDPNAAAGPATATFQCPACHERRRVALTKGSAGSGVRIELATLQHHLEYATCPSCGARKAAVVAEHARRRTRDRLMLAGGYAAVAVLAVMVPMIALLPPAVGLLLWALMLRPRWRRRMWLPIVGEAVLFGTMVAWVIEMRRYAYAVPVCVVAMVLWPRGDPAEPFTTAAEQLTFGDPLL